MKPDTATPPGDYHGRFAPSPTGPLHAGSLVAALASYLDAKAHGGQWHLRIDDIDPPRAVPGSVDQICRSLTCHGLDWDGSLDRQSTHATVYDAALARLEAQGHLFFCACTRATLDHRGCCGQDCRQRQHKNGSLRVNVPADCVIHHEDVLLGPRTFALGEQLSDFIVRRRDGLYAYQLAAAVDDGDPLISHVIRGADLLDSTPRQRLLQGWLGLPPPVYGHLPVLRDSQGNKLSKQAGARALADDSPGANLRSALASLGQSAPPPTLTQPRDLLEWAIVHWQRDTVPQ